MAQWPICFLPLPIVELLPMFRGLLFILCGCLQAAAQISGTAANTVPVIVDTYVIPQFLTQNVTDNFIKTVYGDGWNAGAVSTAKALGDCSVVGALGFTSMIGLSKTQLFSYPNIDYAIYIYNPSNLQVYEGGTLKFSMVCPSMTLANYKSYTFKVERQINKVLYFWSNNGTTWNLFYTSLVPSTGAVYHSFAMYSSGSHQAATAGVYDASRVNFLSSTGFVADTRKYKRVYFGTNRTVIYRTDTNPVTVVPALPIEAVQN